MTAAADKLMTAPARIFNGNIYPYCNSVAAKRRGPNQRGLPAYVNLPRILSLGKAAYLGASYNPFAPDSDPNSSGFQVRNLKLPGRVDASRLHRRRELLQDLDHIRRDIDSRGDILGLDTFYRDGMEMVTNTKAQNAFDIHKEPPAIMLLDSYPQTLVLTGPTGCGKSQLALDLAERLGAEIVSMDSMAVYRRMDIGTAKPTREERRRVPHHLLDVLEPWESASVAWWLERAAACCRDITQRGKRPLFVGGTPLYLKALLHGLFDGPPADEVIRRRLSDESASIGSAALHARLAAVDPISAARLHSNDVRRVIRALEVWELTGRPISAWQTQWTTGSHPPEDSRCLCLDLPRPELYARIDARVERMIAEGLVDEVRALRQMERPLSREAAQALGYKEMLAYLDGGAHLSDAIRHIQMRSRNFAKRQMTWFRQLPVRRIDRPELTFALWTSTIQK